MDIPPGKRNTTICISAFTLHYFFVLSKDFLFLCVCVCLMLTISEHPAAPLPVFTACFPCHSEWPSLIEYSSASQAGHKALKCPKRLWHLTVTCFNKMVLVTRYSLIAYLSNCSNGTEEHEHLKCHVGRVLLLLKPETHGSCSVHEFPSLIPIPTIISEHF